MSDEDWIPLDAEPDVRWRPAKHIKKTNPNTVMVSTPGGFYKLVRQRDTGEVKYFKHKSVDELPPDRKSPAELIDAEPKKKGQVRYRVGALCWFVDSDAKWYLCKVLARQGSPSRITIKPETGWDAERKMPWPYADPIQFPAYATSPMFMRLRPLKARYV